MSSLVPQVAYGVGAGGPPGVVGQPAQLQLNSQKGKVYQGRVAQLLPAFNEQTQSYTALVHFTDSLGFRIVGTQVQANIVVAASVFLGRVVIWILFWPMLIAKASSNSAKEG
jgi:hypothetical protein